MNSLKMMRGYKSSIRGLLDQLCPRCGNILVATGYQQYYLDALDNKALECWCEREQELISLWQTSSDAVSIAKVFAADFIQDNQVLLVNDSPTLFSTKLKSLVERCPICERDGMHGTGNMFRKSRSKVWSVEYWCTYDREVFSLEFGDTTPLIQEIVTEAIAHGQFSPDL
jgi:hypothetical protein